MNATSSRVRAHCVRGSGPWVYLGTLVSNTQVCGLHTDLLVSVFRARYCDGFFVDLKSCVAFIYGLCGHYSSLLLELRVV